IFSYSRLSLYEQCPYRFYSKYVLQKDEPVTEPLALGKAVHKAIEDKINGVNHQQAVFNSYVEAEFHHDISYEAISALVGRAPIQQGMGETEIYFKLPLADKENAPIIQGFVDVLQPDGSIIDWKTNRLLYGALDTRQLALYAWAICQLKGFKNVSGSYYFLRFRKENSYLFREEDMEDVRHWALERAREMNERLDLLSMFHDKAEQLFPAKPSRLCSHCPFAKECVYYQGDTIKQYI